jgi:hypothetical protein
MGNGTHPEAEPVGKRYTIEERSEVAELTVTVSGVRVVVATSPFGSLKWILVEHFFTWAAAIRCIGAVDLNAHWRDEPFQPGYHLYRVSRGGWLEQELQTPGMLNVTCPDGPIPEWLVIAGDRAVNIVGSEPLVREHARRVGRPLSNPESAAAGHVASPIRPESSRGAAAGVLHLAAEPVGRVYSGTSSDTVEIALASPNPGGLRVVVVTNAEGSHETVWVEYVFAWQRGFRYLDEGDLIRFWESGAFRSGQHLYRVTAGGWLDQELQVPGTFPVAAGLQEWFIATGNRSVSVIAGAEPPLVREFRGR